MIFVPCWFSCTFGTDIAIHRCRRWTKDVKDVFVKRTDRISPSRMWNCVIFMKWSKQHKDSKSTVKLKINCRSFRGILVRVTSGSRATAWLIGWSLLAAWCTVDVWIAAGRHQNIQDSTGSNLISNVQSSASPICPYIGGGNVALSFLIEERKREHKSEDLHSQNQDQYTIEDSEQNQILRAFEQQAWW